MSLEIPLKIVDLAPVNGVFISVLRLDLIHPLVGGNKLFKLKYNIQKAIESGLDTIVTLGGPYSNHIAATAYAGQQAGFKTIGLIRGDEHTVLNHTLQAVVEKGMELRFIDRQLYRKYREDFAAVEQLFKNAYCIPEGGSNALSVKGCREIVPNTVSDFDFVACATGTGTTLAGLSLSLQHHQKALGIAVLKGANYLDEQVKEWINAEGGDIERFAIFHDYHFGGYASQHPVLTQFVNHFNDNQPFKIEPVYTGRMFYALMDLIEKNYFSKGIKLLVIHTGGMQYLEN